jgi:hypothetical protein
MEEEINNVLVFTGSLLFPKFLSIKSLQRNTVLKRKKGKEFLCETKYVLYKDESM